MDKVLARGQAAIELYQRPEYRDIARLDRYIGLIDRFVTGISLQSAILHDPNMILLVYTAKKPENSKNCWHCGNELNGHTCQNCCR